MRKTSAWENESLRAFIPEAITGISKTITKHTDFHYFNPFQSA